MPERTFSPLSAQVFQKSELVPAWAGRLVARWRTGRLAVWCCPGASDAGPGLGPLRN